MTGLTRHTTGLAAIFERGRFSRPPDPPFDR